MSQPRTMPQPGGMPKPQGQPAPMPNPNNASPMAGLGSVEDRVAAYRGNPAPLQQRYSMSQDLLDLLALQKIKSEKEAAARQMQLQMGQQQAAQGQESMTVAQQREKEVVDLTKNELAQQRGETAGQQMAQQQEAMKRMLGGVAAAPGAATAAQPKMMATGGIVAFAEGGEMPEEQNPDFDADGNPRPRTERERIMAQNARLREMRGNAQALSALRGSRMAGLGTAAAGVPERIAEFNRPRRPDVTSATQAVATQGALPSPAVAAPQADVPAPATAPVAPGLAAPRPAAPAGLAALPSAGGIPGGAGAPGTPNDPLARALRDKAMGAMNTDPQAQRLSEEARQQGKLEFPEEQARRGQYVDRLQKMYDQEFDPEKQRERELISFLTGAGGRRYGVLGAGAQAAEGYRQDQTRQQMDRLKGIEDANQGIFSLRKNAAEKGIAGGEKAFEQGSIMQRQGMDTGRGIYNTETQARDNALNREVEKLKVQAQQAATAVQREGLDFSRMQGHLNTIVTNRAKAVEAVQKRFGSALSMVEMQLQAKPTDKALLQQRSDLALKIEAELDNVTKDFDDAKALVESRLYGGAGGSGSGGYTVKKKTQP